MIRLNVFIQADEKNHAAVLKPQKNLLPLR